MIDNQLLIKPNFNPSSISDSTKNLRLFISNNPDASSSNFIYSIHYYLKGNESINVNSFAYILPPNTNFTYGKKIYMVAHGELNRSY